ncbi:MAG: tRNA lysidine(34) synthetase TilS [Bacteroidia bacterium]
MVKNIKLHLRELGVNLREHRILVAISGGADSMLLAWLLHKWGAKIALAHCNYHLRGEESEEDERFVRRFAEKLGVPLWVKSADKFIHLFGLQNAARNIRYAFFEELMAREKYDFCATAHHADDNLETLIMSLLNGNVDKMLSSIPAKRECYIRPLLKITKNEILNYCEMNKLEYRTDMSNYKDDYTRNYVRNVVNPTLHKIGFTPYKLAEKEKYYTWEKSFIARTFELILSEVIVNEELIFDKFLAKYDAQFLSLCIRYWLLGYGEKNIWFNDKKVIEAKLGTNYPLTYYPSMGQPKYCLIRTQLGLKITDYVEVAKIKNTNPVEVTKEQLTEAGLELMAMEQQVRFDFVGKEELVFGVKNQFYLDYDKLSFPLTVRRWDKWKGEKMQPFGMKGQKKISDIFVDNKYSILEKERAFLIEDTEKIILLTNFRISEQVKIDDSTVSVLRITIH